MPCIHQKQNQTNISTYPVLQIADDKLSQTPLFSSPNLQFHRLRTWYGISNPSRWTQICLNKFFLKYYLRIQLHNSHVAWKARPPLPNQAADKSNTAQPPAPFPFPTWCHTVSQVSFSYSSGPSRCHRGHSRPQILFMLWIVCESSSFWVISAILQKSMNWDTYNLATEFKVLVTRSVSSGQS